MQNDMTCKYVDIYFHRILDTVNNHVEALVGVLRVVWRVFEIRLAADMFLYCTGLAIPV
jgi:hypothetical protein